MKIQDLKAKLLEYDTTGKPLSAMPTEELKMLWSKCDCKDHSCSKCMAVKHNLLQRKAQAKESIQKVTEASNDVIMSKAKICITMCDKIKQSIEYYLKMDALTSQDADEIYDLLSNVKDKIVKLK